MVSSRDQARKLEPTPRLMSVWGSDEHYRRLNGILDTKFVIISTGMKSLHKLLQFCIQDMTMTMTMTKKLVGSRRSAHFQVCRPLLLVWNKKGKLEWLRAERLFYDRVRDCTCGRASEREKNCSLTFFNRIEGRG